MKSIISFPLLYSALMFWVIMLQPKPSQALNYNNIPTITKLNEENFNKLVLESTLAWTVAFYAEWCPESQQLENEFINASISLQGIIQFGVINGDQNPMLRQQFLIKTYPTILHFGDDKHNQPQRFQRPKKPMKKRPREFVTGISSGSSSLMQMWRSLINQLYPELYPNGHQEYNYKFIPEIVIPPMMTEQAKNNNIHQNDTANKERTNFEHLNESTFNMTIFGSNQVWIVNFCFKNDSGCDNLDPLFKFVAKDLKNLNHSIRFGLVDGQQSPRLIKHYQIRKYPTVLMFDQRVEESSKLSIQLTEEELLVNDSSLASTSSLNHSMEPSINSIADYVTNLLFQYYNQTR